MHPAQQRALVHRALRLIGAGAGERGEPATSPVSRYLDPARYAAEIQHVFRRFPLAVAPAAGLAAPGATLALDVAGTPLLFVRGADGELRGFLNACRHRGARLQPAGVRQDQRVLVCPYHSWSYTLDGALRGRPDDAGFPHAPPSACALVRVPAGEALGLVWAVPRAAHDEAEARLALDDWLGPFAGDLRHWGYDRWVPFHQREFANPANWKIPFEANLETYHFQFAHRDSIAPLFHDNLLVADAHGPHQRLFLPKRSLAGLRDQPESDWDVGRHANVIYYFFPATFLLHEGDHCNAFTVLPEGVGASRVLATTLVPEAPATGKARLHWEKNVASFWGALDEDFALGASVQATLASGANAELRFGATECCAAKFHADVEAALAGEVAGEVAWAPLTST